MTTTRAAMALLLFFGLSAVSHAQDYIASFTAATSVSVPAATHGKGTTDKVAVRLCYSTEFRYTLRPGTDYTWTAASNGNIAISLTASTTGECRITGAVSGSAGGSMPDSMMPLSFADGASESALLDFLLPADWAGGAITLSTNWRTDQTNEIRVGARAKCGTSAGSVVASWSETATYVTTSHVGTTEMRHQSFSLTAAACTPGQRVWVQILRDGAHSEDTTPTAVKLLSANAETVRSMRMAF